MGTIEIIVIDHDFDTIIQWLIRNVGPRLYSQNNRQIGQGWCAEKTPSRLLFTIDNDDHMIKFKKKWI